MKLTRAFIPLAVHVFMGLVLQHAALHVGESEVSAPLVVKTRIVAVPFGELFLLLWCEEERDGVWAALFPALGAEVGAEVGAEGFQLVSLRGLDRAANHSGDVCDARGWDGDGWVREIIGSLLLLLLKVIEDLLPIIHSP